MLAAWTLAVLLLVPAQEPPNFKVYTLSPVELAAAAEVVRGLLSPEGKLVEDRQNHRLIVYDRPEVHEAIAGALRRISVPSRNVRIRVTSSALRSAIRKSAAISGDVASGGPTVRARDQPPPSSVEVRGERTLTRLASQQDLLVANGGRGSISISEAVPHRDWFWTWGGAQGLWSVASGVSWSEVRAALLVEPLIQGEDAVRVRLIPEFSYSLDRARMATEVHQLAADVVVGPGAEVDLGDVPVPEREFLDRFLAGYDDSGQTHRLTVRLRVTVE